MATLIKNYQIRSDEGATLVRFFADPDFHDWVGAAEEMAASEFPYNQFWDVRNVVYRLSHGENQIASERLNQLIQGPARIAILVSDDVSYGKCRQFGVYSTVPDRTSVQVFRDESEAFLWLFAHEQETVAMNAVHGPTIRDCITG